MISIHHLHRIANAVISIHPSTFEVVKGAVQKKTFEVKQVVMIEKKMFVACIARKRKFEK